MKLSLWLILVFNISIFAQVGYQISGVVIDEAGMPIPGVNVIVANTTTGTATDFDGQFQLAVSNGDVLKFSYIGYISQSVNVTGQKSIEVTLKEDASTLDEVVVVGYGARKKSHLTGAIAKVGGDEVAAVQAARVDDALAGKLPGVLIQNQSGEPGADPKIQIRAASSVSGDSSPLIVVDGFPISGSLATVNPNDIQSMEVLKDAASAAIYGSRGANGVILITTKKGKAGKTTFSYNAYTSFSSKYRDNLLLTSGEWADIIDTNIANGTFDVSEVEQDVPGLIDYRINAYRNSPDVVAVEDWLFQNGHTQSHDFSMSGGTENVNFFASMGYQNTEGIVQTQGFEKLNARLNVDAKLGDKFKAGLSFNGFTSDRDIVAHDMRDLMRAYSISPIYHTEESIAFVQQLDAQATALGLNRQWFSDGDDYTTVTDPTTFDAGARGTLGLEPSSIFDLQPGDFAHDWHYGRRGNGIGGSGDAGPAAKLDNAKQWQKTYYANISSYIQYEILEGLTLKTVLGGDLNDTQDYYYQGVIADSRERLNQTDLDQTDLKRFSYLSETTLSYAKVFGKHDVSAVAGFEFQNTYFKGTSLNATNVPFGDIINYNLLAPEDITVTERDETRTRRSVFGRVNYAYDNRYLASVSVRRDGDSRFGVNKRFETFPALSVGWNVHNEAFWGDDFAMSLLKLRFSTGSLGTTSFLGSYDSLSLLSDTSTTVFGTAYLLPDNVANPDLTWQTNTETNYGIDLGFVNNRFRLSVDYYTSDIEDMLINQSVSEVLGTPSIVLNTGDVRSSGVEFEASASIVNTQDFSWSVSGNLSTVNTEITDLGGLESLPDQIYGQSGRGPVFRNYVGGEIGEMWGLETIGEVEMEHVYDPTANIGITSGEYYVVDQDGDGDIDSDDYVKIGQNTPDFYWGFNTNLRYKNFDLAMQFQGAQGGDVYNIDPLYYNSQWGGRLRASFDADNDGIADHNGQFYDRARDQTDALVQDASYIALRNITLGYTINSQLMSKIGASSARVYAAATNLLYIMADNYTSYNPEGINMSGSDYAGPTTSGTQVGESPVVRSFTLGLNLNF
ncbi:TonB-dependent receptor [Tamlana sp. 62-3]|uniref:TonB-dependent receptor n=1 Tax=Neotamlana sargassicola TaxID=2883125 RepID=A0A9X1L488_9FLAO|nr:TonB-dependent receptor [Tamlana sargassicola]MCB4807830.1 TonB-dependent receptor [Tamlana sargassicola]